MRALQITELSGPRDGIREVEVDEPGSLHPQTGEPGVIVDVESAGVSFPEVLQSRGRYQLQP